MESNELGMIVAELGPQNMSRLSSGEHKVVPPDVTLMRGVLVHTIYS